MGLSKEDKKKQICIKCGCTLNPSNQYSYIAKQGWRICKKCINKKTANNTKKYKKQNPLRFKAYDLRTIYKGDIETEDLELLWKEQQGKCAICKVRITKDKNHIDHIIPVSKGGSTVVENLQFLCEKCNRGKYTWTQEEYVSHCKRVSKNME